MTPYFKIASLFFLITLFSVCSAMENVFYVLRDNTSLPSKAIPTLNQHANKIHILISQAYYIDKNGTVSGSIHPDIIQFANQHSMKLMALVTNAGFDRVITHHFLTHPTMQDKALEFILDACAKNHLYGVQFDFERVAFTDKEALTHFFQLAANQLHKKGYVVSFAIAPTLTDGPFPSDFQKRLYENWEGAYDVKALGQSADFITLMAYDQHIDRVTPGPNASIRWVEAALQYALKYIPAQKLSLGVPNYSGYWYTGTRSNKPDAKLNLQYDPIRYDTAMQLITKNHATLHWDNTDKVNYTFYERNWLNDYIFLENAKSFRAKLELAKKYRVRGISVFRIGSEDPDIWNLLTSGEP